MTGLAKLLAEADPFARLKVRSIDPISLERAGAELIGDGAERQTERTGDLQARIASAAARHDLDSLSRRDLRDGCAVFFHPPAPPGRSILVGTHLVRETGRLKRRAAFFSLINAYLDAFDVGDPDVGRLGSQLSELARDWPWRPEDIWPTRIRDYALLDPQVAPNRISHAVLSEGRPVRSVLSEAGFDTDVRRRGGLAEAAFRSACVTTNKLRADPAILPQGRLIEWSETSHNAIAFPASWPLFALSLFLPWAGAEPSPDHKRLLLDTALAYGGDPRIRPARWRDVPHEGRDVVLRWLTKASVEQFFDIVSETMTDRPDMWADRRRFWTRYLQANLISEAWVVFGSDGAWRADQAARTQGDAAFALFGRLASGGGRTSEHAALIMKIGTLTIVEWSHNGSWNIWREGEARIPPLFRHNNQRHIDYQPAELMNAPTSGRHSTYWRSRVAEVIRRETGLRP